MSWVLILTFYASMLSHGDSVSMLSQEFSTKEKCISAGKFTHDEFQTLLKSVKYICVEK
jgi:hypothetical protein